MKLHRTGAYAGIALASLLAVSACGSDNTSTTTNATAGASTSASADCATGQVAASGSTAQKTAMNAWTTAYAKKCGAQINYSATGSGAGVKDFTAGKVAFAGSDSALKTGAEQTAADARCKTGKAIDIPGVATAVAVVFNVKGVTTLTLTPAEISGIFQGTIKTWNDAAITKSNAGVTLPATAISVVYRSKDSGTTDNFTKFLAAQTPDWKLGTGKGWKGKVGTGAPDSAGVVSALTSKDGSIAYVDAPDAKKNSLAKAALDTGSGAVELSDDSVGKALAAATPAYEGNNLKLKLNYGLKQAGAYPAALVTYEITCEKGLAADQVKLTKSFLDYVTSDAGQQAASDAGYSKLPAAILTKAAAAAAAVS